MTNQFIGVQQNLINTNKETTAILEFLCSEANKLSNCAVYYARQMFFKNNTLVTGFDLVKAVGKNKHFTALPSEVAVQSCITVGESLRSYSKLIKKFNTGEITNKPQLPKYRKLGYAVVTFPKRSLKVIKGQIRFPLGRQVKAWFGIKEFFLPMPTNLNFNNLKEIRIVPKNKALYAEFVYPVESIESNLNLNNCLSLDHGINNWLTGVSNVGTSFIIDGKHLKSVNQFWNKQVAFLMKDKPNGFWSNRLARITEKRNRQMRDAVNKAARLVINHCLENNIGTIIFGWNKGQKDSINMGAKTNQKFVQIPTGKLKQRIKELCEIYGMRFEETEESYTSKASFLDSDLLPIFSEKPEGWQPSGKRVKRGLYQTAKGWLINADGNGAANIGRKVAVILGLDLSGTSRGALTSPLKLRFWAIQESQRL